MILISRKTSHGRHPVLDIEDQIIDVVEDRAMEGAPTLTVTVSDPNWLIVNAPILDLNVDGKLDHVETYHNTEWYRLVQVSPNEDSLTLTFEDKAVSVLRQYTKKRRHLATAHYTRAMFIRSMVDEARKDGYEIYFIATDLKTQDLVDKGKEKPAAASKAPGKLGFSKGAHLTVKGRRANKTQRHIAEVGLNLCHDLNAPKRAEWALMEALIQESSITDLPGGDGSSVGILQLTSGKRDRHNIKSVITRFLVEGYAGSGGAISIANTTNLPAHMIAQKVQGSAYSDGAPYAQWEAEAKEWVRRFHGVPDGTETPERTLTADGARWFERGVGNGPAGEDSWDAMVRLASEVNARLWVTDNVIYYAFDNSLYSRKPRNVLTREKASVYATSFDWDQGKPVQTMNTTLEGYDFWPGQTLDFVDAGPASTRWLIWSVRRTRSTGQTEVELHSPQKAKKVARPESITASVPVVKKKQPGTGDGSGGRGGVELKSGTAEVVRRAYKVIGTPGQGTHSYTVEPNNWESDKAVDLAIPYGTNLYAAFDGRIGPSFGFLGDPNDRGRFAGRRLHLVGKHDELYYAHMSLFVHGLGPGDKVKAGQLLGWSGSANGVEHLHLGDKTGQYIKRYLGYRQDPGNVPGRGD